MIVDQETLDLTSSIDGLLETLADVSKEGEVKSELMESVCEIATDPCSDTREAGLQLRTLRRLVQQAAGERGLAIGSSGTFLVRRGRLVDVAPLLAEGRALVEPMRDAAMACGMGPRGVSFVSALTSPISFWRASRWPRSTARCSSAPSSWRARMAACIPGSKTAKPALPFALAASPASISPTRYRM